MGRTKKALKRTKQARKSGEEQPELSPVQKQILYALTQEFLTPKQAAQRLGCHVSRIYRHRKKLIELGAMTPQNTMRENFVGCFRAFKNKSQQKGRVRLHAEQWIATVLYGQVLPSYKRVVGSSFAFKGSTIRVFRDSVAVFSGRSFFGDSPESVEEESARYWGAFFLSLSDHLGVILVKDGSTNIRRVKAEYGLVGDELALAAARSGDRVRVRAPEDGKVWFEIDNSFHMHESELKHPTTAFSDLQGVVMPFFNDLRSNGVVLPSELSASLLELSVAMRGLVASHESLLSVVRSLLPPIVDEGLGDPDYFG